MAQNPKDEQPIDWAQNARELARAVDAFAGQIEATAKAAASAAGRAAADSANAARNARYAAGFQQTRTPVAPAAPLTPKEKAAKSLGAKADNQLAMFIVGGVFTIIGAVGLLVSTTVLFSIFGLSSILLLPALFTGIFLAVGLTVLSRGRKTKRFSQKLTTCLNILGKRDSCSVEELAEVCGDSRRQMGAFLADALKANMLPDFYMDSARTTLYAGYEAYSKDHRRAVAEEEAPRTGDGEVDALLADGRRFVTQMADLAGRIDDPEVLNRVKEICRVSEGIFARVADAPGKAGQIRKFMTYYLPTTVKLLSTYVETAGQDGDGENIASIRTNIRGALSTMCTSFQSLLDSLYSEEALDISTDITVLKTLLAEEGLADEGFNQMEKDYLSPQALTLDPPGGL